LRLAAECALRVHISVVVDLDEGLERDAEPLAVIEDRLVVIGNAPGSGVEILPLVKRARLTCAIDLGDAVAAPDRPAAAAGACFAFQQLPPIAGTSELDRCDQTREPRAEHQNRGALGITVELDRPGIRR